MAAGGGRGTLAAAAAAREMPGPAAVPARGVAAAESAAAEVVRRVRPTEESERRRAEVVDYARRLVGAALGCEVFAYGSVPLKTYLPDGDIDLTVLGNTSCDSTLVNNVYCVLESEEQNSDAEFEVKDLDRINAEVRLIKCTIENMIVDISFNQTGGICALCFLELVDRKIGKNHLFKRSIILIKAWCYYESRLLGAHHGLISTYALEILILYIFNLFHKSLHGPLEVLYRFLEYFSKFDWDNYVISLNGPVALSSLPNLIVEATVAHADDLLFDNEFLKSSVDKPFEPSRDSDTCYTRFRPKHLNIIDPLKEYNNLGRSVNRASFHRIRTALSYGARKLGQILMLPSELIPDEIYGFFKTTLRRNGRGVRPDVATIGAVHPSFGSGKDLLEEISNISSKKRVEYRTPHHIANNLGNNNSYVRTNGPTLLGIYPGGHNAVFASSTDPSTRSSHFVLHGPKQYSSFHQENGNAGREKCCMDCYVAHEMVQVSYYTANAFHADDRSLTHSQVYVSNTTLSSNSYADFNTSDLAINKKSWSAVRAENQHFSPLLLTLADLSGDLDLQFRCLRQVQYHLEYLFDEFLQSVQEASSDDRFQNGSFHIPTLSLLLDAHATLPGLLLPSSAKSNEMKLSPVSCSHSTEYVSQHSRDADLWDAACQHNISLPSGTDIPSNGLSPFSSYTDSDSSVCWCYSSEDSPEMHGADAYFPRKSYDTYEERLASSRKNGKILTVQSVKTESYQSSAPRGSFVSHREQVALDRRTKEIITGQPLKVHEYIHSDRKIVEEHNCGTQKEFVRRDDETSHTPKHRQDSKRNLLQNGQHDTDMEFARPPSVIRQMPKYQPFNNQNTAKECASSGLSRNLPRKLLYGTRKEHEILDWPTRQLPICEPLKLQNQSRVYSKKNSARKQNCNNHNEFPSSITTAEHIPCSGGVSTLNGIQREINSNKLDENGSLWPLLPEVPLSLHSIYSREKHPASDTSESTNSPLETIEFGSLGPFALTFSLPKSNKSTNMPAASKMLTDGTTSVVQTSRAGATHSRSPRFCKVGNEDEFPPRNAGVR